MIAVIIVNWNSGRHLKAAVDSLMNQTLPPGKILIVDNASNDGSADSLADKAPSLEIIRLDDNIGFAAANNLAIRNLPKEIEWVALLNPDAVATPSWLEALLSASQENPEFDFFASRALAADSPDTLDGAGDAYHFSGLVWRRGHGRPSSGRFLNDEEVFSPCGAAALYKREAWLRAGGMDERFFCYLEDVDLGFRLRLLGYRCLYVADAVVEHEGSYSTGRNSNFSVYHGHRNLVWCFFKNLPFTLLVFCLIPHLVMTLAAVTLGFLRGQGKVILKAKADAIAGLRRVLEERKRIQNLRRAGTLEILRSFNFALIRR